MATVIDGIQTIVSKYLCSKAIKKGKFKQSDNESRTYSNMIGESIDKIRIICYTMSGSKL